MALYWQGNGVTIVHADARDVLPGLTETVDLIVTDPPYGQNWQSHHRSREFDLLAGDDAGATGMVTEVLKLALRLLRQNRHLYVFGPWNLAEMGLAVRSQVELIWDKGSFTAGDLAIPWGKSHEPVQFAVYDPSPAERRVRGDSVHARLRSGTVLRFGRLTGVAVADHPTEKPVLLLQELIETSSHLGELVLDPFMGSGSTLVAAVREGRRAIGIEIEEQFCERAVRRLQQLSLLVEQPDDEEEVVD